MLDLDLRGKLYKLSSLLFLYLDEKTSTKLCRYSGEIINDDRLPNDLKEKLIGIKNMFCIDSNLSDIRTNYTKLFITYYPATLCPPYAHVYLDVNPVDMQHIITELLKNLRLTTKEEFKELKDHISLIFEVLYFLTLVEDRKTALEVEKEVLTRFILSWSDKFFECISKYDNKYYGLVADFISKFIEYLRFYLL